MEQGFIFKIVFKRRVLENNINNNRERLYMVPTSLTKISKEDMLAQVYYQWQIVEETQTQASFLSL